MTSAVPTNAAHLPTARLVNVITVLPLTGSPVPDQPIPDHARHGHYIPGVRGSGSLVGDGG